MAKKIVAFERIRRGPALFPSLTEIAALLTLGTPDQVRKMHAEDEATQAEITRRIGKVME